MQSKFTRRRVLTLGGGTAALALLAPRIAMAQDGFDSRQFMELSARLLQVDASDLDEDYAGQYLSALIGNGKEAALKALAAGQADPDLEQDIYIDWYSGIRTRNGEQEVVTYTDALLWEALDYTKPQGVCGGDTGYWSEAPNGG